MFVSLQTYFARHVVKRLSRILIAAHPYIAMLAAYILVFKGQDYDIPKLALGSFSSKAISYNTVVFGFCVTAIALIIAIPNSNFLYFVARNREDAYRDLAFVFSWTGVVHWLAFVTDIYSFVVYGSECNMLSDHTTPYKSAWLFFVVSLQIYAVLQFLVNLIATFEIADLYGMWLVAESRKRTKQSRKY